MPRYSVETIEAAQKLLLSYRDNLRVEVESGVPVVAKTVAELRSLSAYLIFDGNVPSIEEANCVTAVKSETDLTKQRRSRRKPPEAA